MTHPFTADSIRSLEGYRIRKGTVPKKKINVFNVLLGVIMVALIWWAIFAPQVLNTQKENCYRVDGAFMCEPN